MSKEKLYSNPVRVFTGFSKEASYTFEPEGTIPFCVRVSIRNHIPINVMVFSDTKENAVERVKKSLAFAIENIYKNEEPQHRDLLGRKEKQAMYKDYLKNYTWEVCRIEPNQLFKIGWACNDTI